MIDLDSHLMEPRDYLAKFAPSTLIEALTLHGAPSRDVIASGDGGQWSTRGAFDRAERITVLDAFGIDQQIVLPGISHVAHLGTSVVVESARAQRRAALAWADDDPRFVPVAIAPIDDAASAVQLIEEAAAAGCRAVLMTTGHATPTSPTDAQQSTVWDALRDTGLIGVLHFGTTGSGLPDAWRTGPAGAADAADAIDVVIAHHGAEAVLARMALSGLLAGPTPPRLLIAEHGASWLPGLCTSLDACQRAFRSLDPTIPQAEPLSIQLCRAVTVVPFIFEPVGDLIDRIGDDVLSFGTDHPHPEGGKDPIRSFTTALGNRDPSAFFDRNAQRLLG